MIISDIKLKNYRNLKEFLVNFDNKINYIYGKNAQGKTNLLESIWMLTGARSFRKTKDKDIVKFGEEYAKIEANTFLDGRKQTISVNFAQGKRKLFLNKVAQKYPTKLIGKLKTVVFTPLHLNLIKGGPENRRKFLDCAICQIEPNYTQLIALYNQNLKQRNALIKQIFRNKFNNSDLDIWDFKISSLGAKILKTRIKHLDELSKTAIKVYGEMSNENEEIKISYMSSIHKSEINKMSEEDLQKLILEKLNYYKDSDIKQGFTSVGPHKDDIEIKLKEKSIKDFGSQGQVRSTVLSLKIAESDMLEKSAGEPPVILLDDVMSELDEYRQRYFIDKIRNKQIFITGCDENLANFLNAASIFCVNDGGIVKK